MPEPATVKIETVIKRPSKGVKKDPKKLLPATNIKKINPGSVPEISPCDELGAGNGSPLIKLIINPLTVEFMAGVLLGIYYLNNSHNIRFSKVLLFISFLSLLFISYLHESIEIQGWNRIIIFGMPSFLIILFSIEVEKQGFIFHKYLILIGDASYSIYLSHLLTLNVVAKVFNIFLYENYIFELFMIIAMITIALAWGLISYKYIETPIINFTKKIHKEKI